MVLIFDAYKIGRQFCDVSDDWFDSNLFYDDVFTSCGKLGPIKLMKIFVIACHQCADVRCVFIHRFDYCWSLR